MTSTEIAVRENGTVAERDIIDGWVAMASDVFKLAAHICDTEFVPDNYRGNAPAVAAAILTGRELGIGPMTSLRHVQVVKGSPSLSAEYKRARVLAAGHDLDIAELNTTRCKVIGRRKGKPPLEITFTMDDAKRAGLLNPSRSGKPGAWQTRPRRMLFARASTEVCDFLFTDITNGLPTTELLMEDVGDPFEGYAESPGQLPPAANGGQPGSRTAQRKPRTQNPPSPARGVGASAPAAPDSQNGQGAGEGALPPLPGEDNEPSGPAPAAATTPAAPAPETPQAPSGAAPQESAPDDPNAPGSERHRKLVGAVQGQLKRLGFTVDAADREKRLPIVARLAGVNYETEAINSTSDFDEDELSAAADTLARCRDRKALDALLKAAKEAALDDG